MKSEPAQMNSIVNIARKLNGISQKWAIVGGANLVLRGCNSFASDVDIITTRSGAFLIAEKLKKHSILGVMWRESKIISSYYFVANIEGINVDVMGEPINLVSNKWVCFDIWKASVEKLVVQNIAIPVTTLEYERKINSFLGNQARVGEIDKHLCRDE